MSPILQPNNQVVTFNWFYFFSQPKVGDIIAFKKDGKVMIKRIGKLADRNVLVYGDNEEDSLDSRKFGAIKKTEIIGKVIYII